MASRVEQGRGYFPGNGDGWEPVAPGQHGWNAARLEELCTFAAEHHSTALLMVQGGRLLLERYWRGWDAHTAAAVASVQKSVVSLLFGIAGHDGAIKLDQPVDAYLGAGWSAAPSEAEHAVTMRHLLSMSSGLDEQLRSEAAPGTAWFYNTPAYYRVKAAIQAATGTRLQDFFHERLAGPIGLQSSDWRGEMLAAPPGQQLHASGRDLARIGLLVLRGGEWAGRRVVGDEGYLAQMQETSQPLNLSYGYLWWLNGKERYLLPAAGASGEGPLVPSAPADLRCGLGAGDKKIYVCPSLDLVVVRHGGPAFATVDQARSRFDVQLWQRIMAAADQSPSPETGTVA